MAGYIGSKTSVTQVDGYNRTEADDEFVNDPNSVITVSGSNVGIGTSSPDVFSRGYTRTVGISSNGSTSLAIQSASDPQYPAIEMGRGSSRQFLITNQAAYSTIGTLENTPLRFITNGSEAMRLDSSGNLLVGTTSTSRSAVAGI